MERDFKGIWIPKEIWLSDELGWIEKLMLTEIDSLDNDYGCFAGNDYFSKFFNISKRRVIDIINNLEHKGFIKKEIIYKKDSKQVEKRIIRVVKKSSHTWCRKVHSPGEEKFTTPGEEKFTDNNTLFNNTFNNTDNKRNNVEKDSTTHLNCKEIVDYLNLKTGSQFRYTTKKTQTLIKTKLKDKYTVEDFKKVIDIKTYQWINDSKMKSYLRPETLFGSKFESYLNEWRSATNEINYRVDSKGVKRDRLGIEIL